MRKVEIMKEFAVENCGYINLKSGLFANRCDLVNLQLNANEIDNIPDYTFTGASNLVFLSLEENGIETISEFAFSGLKNLKFLYLNKNSISHFNFNTFTDLVSLKFLFAPDNQIKALDELMFENNKNLSIVNFRGNRIATIHPYLFHKLRNFTLDLSENDCFDRRWEIFNASEFLEKTDECRTLQDQDSKQIALLNDYEKLEKEFYGFKRASNRINIYLNILGMVLICLVLSMTIFAVKLIIKMKKDKPTHHQLLVNDISDPHFCSSQHNYIEDID